MKRRTGGKNEGVKKEKKGQIGETGKKKEKMKGKKELSIRKEKNECN